MVRVAGAAVEGGKEGGGGGDSLLRYDSEQNLKEGPRRQCRRRSQEEEKGPAKKGEEIDTTEIERDRAKKKLYSCHMQRRRPNRKRGSWWGIALILESSSSSFPSFYLNCSLPLLPHLLGD